MKNAERYIACILVGLGAGVGWDGRMSFGIAFIGLAVVNLLASILNELRRP